MVHHADAAIGRVVRAFESSGLWQNTLFIFGLQKRLSNACLRGTGCSLTHVFATVSDNGGASYLNGTSGGNNYPLKGGSL